MKKNIATLFFLIPMIAAAQSNLFTEYPIHGKISKYEIVKMVGDSLNEKEMPIEEVTYDNLGHELSGKYYTTYSNHINRLEQSSINGNTITTFECECNDLTNFIKTFTIRDKAELKYQKGGATNNPPTEYCTIKTLDKKSNVVNAKRFSQRGYQVSEIKSTYDASSNLLTKVVYDFDDSISYTEKNSYSKKGNLTQRISKRNDEHFERKVEYVYNATNELTEELTFENDELKSDFTYAKNKAENKTTLVTTDKLKDSSYIAEEIIFNAENQEVKSSHFFSNGELQKMIATDYYENGKIKTKLIYNAQQELTSKILFVDDKNNNWKEWITYHWSTTVLKDSKITERKATTYKLKLVYL